MGGGRQMRPMSRPEMSTQQWAGNQQRAGDNGICTKCNKPFSAHPRDIRGSFCPATLGVEGQDWRINPATGLLEIKHHHVADHSGNVVPR